MSKNYNVLITCRRAWPDHNFLRQSDELFTKSNKARALSNNVVCQCHDTNSTIFLHGFYWISHDLGRCSLTPLNLKLNPWQTIMRSELRTSTAQITDVLRRGSPLENLGEGFLSFLVQWLPEKVAIKKCGLSSQWPQQMHWRLKYHTINKQVVPLCSVCGVMQKENH